MRTTTNQLHFDALRAANVARCEEVFHLLQDWTPTDWATAFGGEAGEAQNFVKKLRRLDGADANQDTNEHRIELIRNVGLELADTVIYADLLAARLGIDLGAAVREKFNLVSRERRSRFLLKSPVEEVNALKAAEEIAGAQMETIQRLRGELEAAHARIAELEKGSSPQSIAIPPNPVVAAVTAELNQEQGQE